MNSGMARSTWRLAMAAPCLSALWLAGCAQKQEPPKLETIIVPVPENLPAIPETPKLPELVQVPDLVTESRGEDLWHLRSALNVAALICDPKEFTKLVPGYNKMLTTHRTLLTAAVQTELDQFKLKDKRKWQALYDTHMTKLYNQYSLTQQRAAFCKTATETVDIAADLSAEQLTEAATQYIFFLNRAGAITPDE